LKASARDERYAPPSLGSHIFARARAAGGSVAEVIDRTLSRAARRYPEHDGVAGRLVLGGTSNSVDADACALTAAAKQLNRAAIRNFIATEHPEMADELAEFVTIAMAGMSAAARDGADKKTLGAFARKASRAFCREVHTGNACPSLDSNGMIAVGAKGVSLKL
jgi:TetR/AcrR family transcriptional regulator, repressor for divergent bdcA